MTAIPLRSDRGRPPRSYAAAGAAVVAGAGAIAVAGPLLARRPPSLVAVAGLVAVAALLALAVSRFRAVVALGFLLLGVVKVEPAPTDALLAVAIAFSVARLDLRRVPGPMLLTVVALLALNLLSATGAVQLGDSLRFLAITLYLAVFAIWLTMWLTSASRMRLVIGGYVAGAVVTAAISVPAALGIPFPGHSTLIGEGVRAQGLFKDPNVFGPFLVPAALILLEEALRPRLLGLRRSTCVAGVGVLVLGVVFAYSRAGWLNFVLALAVMLAVMAARADAAPHIAGMLAIVLTLSGLAVGAIGASGSQDILRERAQPQRYDTERFDAQRSGVRLAEEHPLGIGPGQFEVVSPISSHSIYVRVMAEQGLIGLAALVVLLGGTLLLAVRNAVAGRDAFGVGSAVLLGSWCGLLANSAFVDTLHWRHLWLLAALIWVASRGRPARAHGGGSRNT
jgi:O-antigen ligase